MTIPFEKNDEIDLKSIFKSFRRNAKQLVIFSAASTIIIFSYLETKPPIWRGSFNILVKKQKSTSTFNPQQIAGNILKLNPMNDNSTQKLILQSPLVLKPVFEYVVDGRAC